jgi:hypothetical protein
MRVAAVTTRGDCFIVKHAIVCRAATVQVVCRVVFTDQPAATAQLEARIVLDAIAVMCRAFSNTVAKFSGQN